MRLLAAVVTLVSLAAGCGDDGGDDGDSTPAARAPAEFGDYPGNPELDPVEAARAYVEALNDRDGEAFCGLVAPYVAGMWDLVTSDPDSVLRRIDGCPGVVETYIGYIEDCCPPKFLGAEVVSAEEGEPENGLRRVEMTISLRTEDTATHKQETSEIEDVVWLSRFDGAWRVAELSEVAFAASLRPTQYVPVEERDAGPPDVAGEERRFAAEVDKFIERTEAREASYETPGEPADCEGGVDVPDPRGDLSDYVHPAPDSDPPPTERADLTGLRLSVSGSDVCVRFETAAAIEGPVILKFQVRDTPQGGFIQGFDVDLREDGSVRVTSGEDQDRRPISVPASVGLSDNVLTLELDTQSFEAGQPSPHSQGPPPLEQFAFIASTTAPVGDERVLHDDLGPGDTPQSFDYPSGQLCELSAC